MKSVFWQNMLSIHQSAFVNALSKTHDVVLIAEKESDVIRNKSGWNKPIFNCNNVIINPADKDISKWINERDTIHILSGLDITFEKYHLTRKLIKNGNKVICYLEPYNWLGYKGRLRRIKYTILQFKYGKKLWGMLPTGQLGLEQYRKVGFKNVFEWGYFTDFFEKIDFAQSNISSTPKLLFVGSLDRRKNILGLLDVMTLSEFRGVELGIIGNGPLINDVIKYSKNYSNITYLGVKPNEEVKKIMQQYDILVLPSRFDGWGAVVNEALFSGMRVVCSDRCGASTLLKEKWRGSIFPFDQPDGLKNTLKNQIYLGIQKEADRKNVKEWCINHISGQTASNYFISICQYLLENTAASPTVPW